ncbi:MAG: AsmA-like C-terminal region-containing protein [Verrucomicrobiales bacterium]
MKRPLLIAFAVMAAGYLIALGGVNFFANLERVRGRLGAIVARAIGEPLEVGRVRVGPLGRVHLFELEINVDEKPDDDEQGRRPFFLGEEIQLLVAPFSLFGEDVRIREVVILRPEFILTRGRDGKLLLPAGIGERMIRPEGAKGSESGGAGEAQAAGVPAGVPVSPGGPAPSSGTARQELSDTAGGTAAVAPLAVPLPKPGIVPDASGRAGAGEGVAVEKGGSVAAEGGSAGSAEAAVPDVPIMIRFGKRNYHFGEILMKRGRVEVVAVGSGVRLFEIEDMEMRMAITGDPPNEGTVSARRVRLFSGIEVENLRADVNSGGLIFRLSNIEGDLLGGKVRGSVYVSPFQEGIPFRAALNCSGVAAGEALAAVGQRGPDIAQGSIGGQLRMLGYLRAPQTWVGRVAVAAVDTRIASAAMPGALAGAAKAAGMEEVPLEECLAEFTIQEGLLRIDKLRVASPQVTVGLRGFVNFQGQLSVATRLYVSEQIYQRLRGLEAGLPKNTRFGFAPFGGGATFARDYRLTGTLGEPAIDFWAGGPQIPLRQLRETLGDIVSTIVARGQEKEDRAEEGTR